MVHDYRVPQVDDAGDPDIEALPFDLERGGDPVFFAEPTQGATAHQCEPLAYEVIELVSVMATDRTLESISFPLRVESIERHARSVSHLAGGRVDRERQPQPYAVLDRDRIQVHRPALQSGSSGALARYRWSRNGL